MNQCKQKAKVQAQYTISRQDAMQCNSSWEVISIVQKWNSTEGHADGRMRERERERETVDDTRLETLHRE
jgi:hypothetical protein